MANMNNGSMDTSTHEKTFDKSFMNFVKWSVHRDYWPILGLYGDLRALRRGNT